MYHRVLTQKVSEKNPAFQMSALHQLDNILEDRIPPMYHLNRGEIARVLSGKITAPMSDQAHDHQAIQNGEMEYYDGAENNANAYQEWQDQVSEAARALAPYYTPPFRRGTYRLEDWGDEVFDFISDNWNALYNDLQERTRGVPRVPRPRTREVMF